MYCIIFVFATRFVLAANLQGGSVDPSYSLDYSSSHVTPGAYRRKDNDDALFRYLVQTFTEKHSVVRQGEARCPDELSHVFRNGTAAEWTKAQGEVVCIVLINS